MALFVHFVCLKSVENIHFYVFLRQEMDSTGLNYPIDHSMDIRCHCIHQTASQTNNLYCFLSIGLKTHISTMDDTTPSTSQNNMGEPPTTLQLTTESPSVLMGPTNVDTTSSGTFNSPHFLTNFTISPINSHSFVTALLFDKC